MEPDDNIQSNHNESDKYLEMNSHNTSETELSSTTREIPVTSSDDYSVSNDENFKLPILKTKVEEETNSIQYFQKNWVDYNKYKNLQDELESQKKQVQELNQKLDESDKKLQNYKNCEESLNTKIKEIQKELDTKNEDINELKKNNATLKEEASKYQSALGVAANFRTSDENHSVQLKKDILSLQDTIESYVTNLKGNIEVNVENIENLLQRYGCLTKITKENQNRPFIKAVLQRYVLDTIIENANDYFDHPNHPKDIGISLESKILSRTNYLCLLLDTFCETRKGTDTITPITSIKIRQEAYVALGNRGFSEIVENDQTIEHNFIDNVKNILNKSLNEYRTINDSAKKQSVENMATNIIRDVIRLFWFRLLAQEPIITISWFEPNTRIDPNTMTGRWEDREEDIDNLVVDLCYFPIIGLNLDDPSKRKLYTRAKVFPRYQSYISRLVKSVVESSVK
ncbi:hypothetical protein C1645_882416 [Glomus cerebriforme]|uniref:Uncharacterized protein n=1 Tax=Glomus cerebriforme TaxID=658196 RepID=A0A397S7K4_9GLOM|nr:hypothetical protein C1645_882416 [Glomus cerebriforme]